MATPVVDKHICTICLNVFNQPKLIDCHHTFCLRCLEDYVENFIYDTFPCPLCRRQISIPTGGVTSFPSNFYIDSEVNIINSCINHKDKKAELYCKQCFDAVCGKCFTLNHRDHAFLDLDSEVTLKEATDQTICLKEQLTTYDKKLQSIEDSLDFKKSELNASAKIAREKIEARVEKICTDAKQFGEQLCTAITGISEKQHAKLDAVNVELQHFRSDVKSTLKLSDDITSNVSVIQVLNTLQLSKDTIKKQTTVQLPEIPEILFPIFTADSTNALSSVQQIGHCKTAREPSFNFDFNFEDLKEDQTIYSPDTIIMEGLSWCLSAVHNTDDSKLDLYVHLTISGSDNPQSCYTSYSITLNSCVDGKAITKSGEQEYCYGGEGWGWSFIDWDEFVDSKNGYLDNNNKLAVSATIRINNILKTDHAN